MSDAASSGAVRVGGWAKTIDAWIVALGKGLLVLICLLVVWRPQTLPKLSAFMDNLVDVDFAGIKVHFDKDAKSVLAQHGITFKDDKMFIGTHNVDDVAVDFGKLTTQIQVLTDQNQKLVASVGKQGDMLNQAQVQLSAPSGTAGASPTLSAAVASVSAAAAQVAAQAQVATKGANQVAEEIAQTASTVVGSGAGYGIVFSSDEDTKTGKALDYAMDEVKKVQAFSKSPITLYMRGKFIASVAYFPTRSDAFAALPQFSAQLPQNKAWVVHLSAWCPQPTSVTSASPTSPEVKNCGF